MLTIRDIWLRMKSILRSARQMINNQLKTLNLTSAEGDVLFHLLAESNGLSQENLAERLDIGKAAISRTVDSLVNKGYVTRERHPGDARAYLLKLTQMAIDAGVEIEYVYNSVYELVKQGINDSEFQRLAVLLEKVAENLHSQEA